MNALLALVCLAAAVAGALSLTRAVSLRSSVLPGVSVAGIDIGGLERGAAERRIAAELGARLDRDVTVVVGKKSFVVSPADLFTVDAAAVASQAFAEGRGSFLGRVAAAVWPGAVEAEVAPVLATRPEAAAVLARLLEGVGRPPVSARVVMRGQSAVVLSGKPGLGVNADKLLADLRAIALAPGVADVDAPLRRVLPEITTKEAKQAALQAETVVAAPVFLTFDGKQIGELRPWQLAQMVRFQPMSAGYAVALDRERLQRALEPVVASYLEEPTDATFKVVAKGERVKVVPSKPGTRLAPSLAQEAILGAALAPTDRTAEVPVAKQAAELTTREAKALGIRERLVRFTTDMGPSSANRIHNVHLIGDMLDGTIIDAGEIFSFNKTVGPRTPERGFLEGQAIVGGFLVPSIGGGVCQTATTVFNAAFETGLPIIERHNHAWYIDHYPMGRDATVYWGGFDLRFRNDLDHPILIKVEYTDDTFTVSFYGTDQGRKIVATTSETANYTSPSIREYFDPTAPKKSVRETTAAAPGFDVTVHRTVYEDGKLLREGEFFTRYAPQNPARIYGPGPKVPEDLPRLPPGVTG